MTPHPANTRVRITRDSGKAHRGEVLTVEEYVSAHEAEDGKAFYWGSTDQGVNDRWFAADACELVQTAEDAAARKPPTRDEVAHGLDLLRDHEAFDCDETEPDGDGAVMLYGKTPDGLRIAVRLVVERVEQVDF